MADQTQAEEQAGTSIKDIVSGAFDDIEVDNPDLFDETAHWTEDDAALLEFSNGDSDDVDGNEVDNEDEEDVPEQETASRGIGIDKLSEAVKAQLGDEYFNALKGMQAQYTRDRQAEKELESSKEEVAALKAEMSNIVSEWEAIKNGDSEDEGYDEEEDVDELTLEAQQLYEGMSPAHKRLFTIMLNDNGVAWARENGYVKMEDVEQREQQKEQAEARRTTLVSAVDSGMEKYGELFGQRNDEGKFVPNPELRDKMQTAYNFLGGDNFKGTLLDLFEYACRDEILANGASAPADEDENADVNRLLQKRRKASSVASGTSSGPGMMPKLYDPSRNAHGRRRMSISDVAKRAARHTLLTT